MVWTSHSRYREIIIWTTENGVRAHVYGKCRWGDWFRSWAFGCLCSRDRLSQVDDLLQFLFLVLNLSAVERKYFKHIAVNLAIYFELSSNYGLEDVILSLSLHRKKSFQQNLTFSHSYAFSLPLVEVKMLLCFSFWTLWDAFPLIQHVNMVWSYILDPNALLFFQLCSSWTICEVHPLFLSNMKSSKVWVAFFETLSRGCLCRKTN